MPRRRGRRQRPGGLRRLIAPEFGRRIRDRAIKAKQAACCRRTQAKRLSIAGYYDEQHKRLSQKRTERDGDDDDDGKRGDEKRHCERKPTAETKASSEAVKAVAPTSKPKPKTLRSPLSVPRDLHDTVVREVARRQSFAKKIAQGVWRYRHTPIATQHKSVCAGSTTPSWHRCKLARAAQLLRRMLLLCNERCDVALVLVLGLHQAVDRL